MIARRILPVALAVALSGCVSVLPKSKPDQLYSFGQAVAGAASATRLDARRPVLLATVGFPRAATGDGILTLTGSRAAYLAQSRWVGPAAVLFREAVERSFDRSSAGVRLIGRGEPGRADFVLRMDVLDFAAVYPANALSPVATVAVRVRLSSPDGQAVDEQSFEVRKRAADNRVGPVVDAYDSAVAEVLQQVVAWSDAAVAKAGARPARR